jgi:hypothetical protein
MTEITTTPAAGFDYTALSQELADNLRSQAARIRGNMKSTVATIIEIGRDLLAVRQHLQHGQFTAWVEAECGGLSMRSVQRYLRAAEFAADKNDTVSLLEPTTFHMLASKTTPPEVGADVMRRLARGEIITHKNIRDLVDIHKRERQLDRQVEERNRRRRKLSPRQVRRQEAEEHQREEIRRRRNEREQARAAEIMARFAVEDMQFLLKVYRDPEVYFDNVIEQVEIALRGRP